MTGRLPGRVQETPTNLINTPYSSGCRARLVCLNPFHGFPPPCQPVSSVHELTLAGYDFRSRILDNAPDQCHLLHVLADKYEQLRALLRSCGPCLVAYSGGVDSAFLACVAHNVLGDKSLAVIADSPSLPRRELVEALAIARQFHFPVRVVQTAEFENPEYLANPANRCYFCKHELFSLLAPLAKAEGFVVIVYGENASDIGDYRPGAQAAAQFQVRAPLKEVGLTKTEIRQLSGELGLPTADKPQMACLSSRIPHGEPVTEKKLGMIEQAENFLRDLGFYDVRVRHHELRVSSVQSPVPGNNAPLGPRHLPLITHLARIEVGLDELPRFLENGNFTRVAQALKQIGYRHVTLDLEGYRRGSTNDVNRLSASQVTGSTPADGKPGT